MSADPSDRSIVAIVETPDEEARRRNPKGAGRPMGSQNRATATMRYMLDQIVAGQMANVDQALRDILNGTPPLLDIDPATKKITILRKGTPPNPQAFVAALTDIMDFNLPRLTRVEVKTEAPHEDIEIPTDATVEEAQRAYQRLMGLAPSSG